MIFEKSLSQLISQNLPFSGDLLPSSAYLVGGAVRDELLNRHRDYLDLDFVVCEDAIAIARLIAKQYQAGFVILDQTRKIARVVFKQGTVDFAQQEGNSLENDLKRRDFTINAIAYHLQRDIVIDPLNGLKDLQQGILRMVSAENLADDPLRLLRAYRQASQLDFTIEPHTQATIQHLADLVTKVAAERVQTEINYLLRNAHGTPWLLMAWEDGLLCRWFPHTRREQVQLLPKIDAVVHQIPHFPCAWREMIPLAKLACLVSWESQIAQMQLAHLKYSRADSRTVTKVVKQLANLSHQPKMSLEDQYFLFLELKEAFPVLAILAIALGIAQDTIYPLIHRYLNLEDRVAHPQAWVTGNDLIQHLQLKPSPQIGTLLTEIQLAQITGKVINKKEALLFAKNWLEEQK